MKKISAFLIALLFFSFCIGPVTALAASYTVEKDGKTFAVNVTEDTIFDGTYTYKFRFSGNTSNHRIDITYPNGATYFWSQSGGTGYGGWSDDYDEAMYVDGRTLCDVIMTRAPKPYNPGKMLAIIFLFCIGAFCLIAPQAAWYLESGWKYENAKPSGEALFFHRFCGVIAMIMGIILIFV